jgi:uncharacterized membrane protein YhiD involved in acid resistance
MTKNTRQLGFVALIAAVAGFVLAALIWSLSNSATHSSQTAQTQASDVSQPRVASDNNTNAQTRADEGKNGATKDATKDKDAAKDKEKDQGEVKEQGNSSVLDAIGFGQGAAFAPHESWTTTMPRILLRLLLATALAAMLALRPRHNAPLVQRNPYVAQTQILLAVVASALMMIVGDNAARAFGIFAAASLVRFRTNIRDPKETVVLLINLAVGLATGVGRVDVGIVLALFVMALLWVLERRQGEQVFRAMELTVKTRNVDATQAVLDRILRQRGIGGEVRQINPPEEGEAVGCVMYFVQMSLNTSTDSVNEEIMAADPNNVESIEWEQQKSRDYIYQ